MHIYHLFPSVFFFLSPWSCKGNRSVFLYSICLQKKQITKFVYFMCMSCPIETNSCCSNFVDSNIFFFFAHKEDGFEVCVLALSHLWKGMLELNQTLNIWFWIFTRFMSCSFYMINYVTYMVSLSPFVSMYICRRNYEVLSTCFKCRSLWRSFVEISQR